MKRLLSSLLLLAGSTLSPLAAAETTPAVAPLPEMTWTVTPAVTSQYLFRGVRLAGASFQPAVDFAYGPLALGLWSSVALEDHASGDGDPEIDFYGSYTIPVGQWSRVEAEFVPGFQLYTYPDAERSGGYYRATFEPSVGANLIVAGVKLTPKAYYDFMLKGATFECTAAVAVPLPALGTELELSASIGTFRWKDIAADVDPAVKNWGDYWTVGAAVPYQVTANSSVKLAVLYSEGRNNFFKQGTSPREENESAVGRAVVTLSYAIDL